MGLMNAARTEETGIRGLVVCGMHRSGTTFIGEILRRFDKTAVIHEPFNQVYGLSDIRYLYPCDLDEVHGEWAINVIENMLAGKARYVRKVSGDKTLKAICRYVSGGRTSIDIVKYRLQSLIAPNVIPVMKDPFQSLLARKLLSNNFGVIIVIRHPVAVWNSIRRMRWQLDLKEIDCLNQLLKNGVNVGYCGALEDLTEVVKFALLWRAIHTYVNALSKDKLLFVVTHEDLCFSPTNFVRQVEEKYGLKAGDKVFGYVENAMNSDTVSVKGNKLHEFNRNSRDLATSWIGKVNSEEELAIRNLTGDLVEEIYGKWYPI